MGKTFAILFVVYMLVVSALFPLIVIELYLKGRDCRAKHNVATCTYVLAPDFVDSP